MKIKAFIFPFVLILFFIACESIESPTRVNPKDPQNPEFNPLFLLSPDKINKNSKIEIELGNITGFMAAHIEIVCTDECVEFIDFTPDKSLNDEYEYVYFYDNSDTSRFILDILITGNIEGLKPSEIIGSFEVNYKSQGQIEIDYETLKIIDINNREIDITQYGLGSVNVE